MATITALIAMMNRSNFFLFAGSAQVFAMRTSKGLYTKPAARRTACDGKYIALKYN